MAAVEEEEEEMAEDRICRRCANNSRAATNTRRIGLFSIQFDLNDLTT